MSLFAGYLLGAPFTRWLHARFDKKPVLMGGTAWFGHTIVTVLCDFGQR